MWHRYPATEKFNPLASTTTGTPHREAAGWPAVSRKVGAMPRQLPPRSRPR